MPSFSLSLESNQIAKQTRIKYNKGKAQEAYTHVNITHKNTEFETIVFKKFS